MAFTSPNMWHTSRGFLLDSVKILVVVVDEPDVQFLVETVFSADDRFSVRAVAAA